MILDRCKELTTRVAEKRRLRQNVDQLKRFQKVQNLVQSGKDFESEVARFRVG